jgi:hypothetical protein
MSAFPFDPKLITRVAAAMLDLDTHQIVGGSNQLQRMSEVYARILAERRPSLPRDVVEYDALCFQAALDNAVKALMKHIAVTPTGRA